VVLARVGHGRADGWPARGRLLCVGEVVAPAVLRAWVTDAMAHELAAVYSDQVVYPQRVMVDRPKHDERLFPAWPTPVLVISCAASSCSQTAGTGHNRNAPADVNDELLAFLRHEQHP
jgi:hypothetical protein